MQANHLVGVAYQLGTQDFKFRRCWDVLDYEAEKNDRMFHIVYDKDKYFIGDAVDVHKSQS